MDTDIHEGLRTDFEKLTLKEKEWQHNLKELAENTFSVCTPAVAGPGGMPAVAVPGSPLVGGPCKTAVAGHGMPLPAMLQASIILLASVRGEGAAGTKGGPSGDLFIIFEVQAHDVFERDGADIHLELPIDFSTAALGGSVDIPTLDGTTTVEVKAGTQPGDRKRLAGKGIPIVNRKDRGDLHIHFKLEVPKSLSSEQRRIIEELREASGHKQSSRPSFFDKLKDLFDPSDD